MTTVNKASAEAERRYPKRTFVTESYVQNAFIAGAEWAAAQASREALAQEVVDRADPIYVPNMTSSQRRAWRRGKKFAVDILRRQA